MYYILIYILLLFINLFFILFCVCAIVSEEETAIFIENRTRLNDLFNGKFSEKKIAWRFLIKLINSHINLNNTVYMFFRRVQEAAGLHRFDEDHMKTKWNNLMKTYKVK